MKIKIGNFDCTECWDGVFYKKLSAFPKITERLILHRWTEADTESLEVIRNVFCGSECYAVCKKEASNEILSQIERFKVQNKTRLSAPAKSPNAPPAPLTKAA